MIRSSFARAARPRRNTGSGSRSMTSASGSSVTQNSSSTRVSAPPISSACDSTSRFEQRLADDGERQPHHLARDVEVHARRPPLPRAVGVRGHHRRVGRDPLAVKCRLQQPPLPQVRGAFARQQPFAEHLLRALEAAALGEIPVMRDQHVADVRRMVEEEGPLAANLEVHDVAVRPREPREERQRIPRRADESAEQQRPSAVPAGTGARSRQR